MENTNTVIAVFADHPEAETAIKKLTTAGFDMKNLSVVGKGYHTDEKVVGFYNTGDRIKFWGTRGALGRLLGPVPGWAVRNRSRSRSSCRAWVYRFDCGCRH
jgi:hypothetical protein